MAAKQHNTPNPPVETAPMLRLEDLSALDQHAFKIAFHEECEAADPNESVVYPFRRAMLRVERFLADRQAAAG